ncbi:MAG: hypothetical protein OQJ84_00635 [Xanthomonadales bacterium]|nr:hypothetical protein [Xanthomonadales bacterium]
MTVHLVFIAIEIFTQPVFPWDAWAAWIYRAKAWFLAGGITDVIGARDWATAASANVYTIDAWLYPSFPSLIPYWAALSLGRWSETLVNLPVLFAGLAMGMALYGQCREHGLSVATSLLSCYLLYSIPLLGTHLALAGYADIWMAGFTGLGFVAIMRGVITRDAVGGSRFQKALGFLMVAFGICVKNEGAVWFLALLAVLLLATCRRKTLLLTTAVAVIGIGLAITLGVSQVDIPLIGKLGVSDGRLVIPFIGSFKLEAHNIWRAYWDNFINMGSWNLLWVAVAASLLLGLGSFTRSPGYRARRTALSLLIVFLATQIFIFGFTNQGLWADTYTAINRLPLHFVPALLFAVIIMQQGLHLSEPACRSGVLPPLSRPHRGSGVSPRLSALFGAALLAFIIVATGSVIFLSKNLPEQTGETIIYPASDFNFAFGSGYPAKERIYVDGFANGYALLTSGAVSIQANDLRALVYTWLPPRLPQEAAFFWRRAGDPGNVIRTEITTPGTRMIDLASEPDWQGEIIEFGFLVAGNGGDTVEVGNASLLPDTLNTRLQLAWRAWTTFETWSQQSINFLHGGDHRQVLALPLLVTGWLLLTLLFLRLFQLVGARLGFQQSVLVAGTLFLLAWMLLDIRWTTNNVKQARVSLAAHWQADEQQRLSNGMDGEIYQYVQRLKSTVLGEQKSRILIIGDESAIDYYLLRTKYHLLPHSVNVTDRFARGLAPGSLDFVIFFGQPADIVRLPGWNRSWQNALSRVDSGQWGTVFRVKKQ